MLNDLIKSNENTIEKFNKNFTNIIKTEKENNEKLNYLIENIENTHKENFYFSDLMLIKENDKEEINQIKREILNKTEFAQPAILLHSYLNYLKFLKEKGNRENNNNKSFFFGPSLGEIISLVCANSITLNKAGLLLHRRGKLMQESCPQGKGAMLNVVGDINKNIILFNKFLEKNEIENLKINLSSIMSKRLLVISGATDSIEKCRKFFKENSIGCRKLIVSAAFHSDLMKEGSIKFREYLFDENEELFFDFPEVSIISTIFPEFIYPIKECRFLNKKEFDKKVKEMLVEQFTRKVDLLDCVRNYVKINKEIGNGNFEYELYDIIKRKNVDLNEFI
jgi:malonyl CoA-acyl carrier protein transacylase